MLLTSPAKLFLFRILFCQHGLSQNSDLKKEVEPSSAILQLPLEIVLEVAEYLPPSSRVFLSLTCRRMRAHLGLEDLRAFRRPNRKLNIEDQMQVFKYFDQYYPNHLFCPYCRKWHRRPRFEVPGILGRLFSTLTNKLKYWLSVDIYASRADLLDSLVGRRCKRGSEDRGPLEHQNFMLTWLMARAHRLGPAYGIPLEYMQDNYPQLFRSRHNRIRIYPKIVQGKLLVKKETFGLQGNSDVKVDDKYVEREMGPVCLWPGHPCNHASRYFKITSLGREFTKTFNSLAKSKCKELKIRSCLSCPMDYQSTFERITQYSLRERLQLVPWYHFWSGTCYWTVSKVTEWMDLSYCEPLSNPDVISRRRLWPASDMGDRDFGRTIELYEGEPKD